MSRKDNKVLRKQDSDLRAPALDEAPHFLLPVFLPRFTSALVLV